MSWKRRREDEREEDREVGREEFSQPASKRYRMVNSNDARLMFRRGRSLSGGARGGGGSRSCTV